MGVGLPQHRLDDAVGVVTGGASGIGRATALGLAAAGASVALIDRDETGVEQAAEEVRGLGASASSWHADLADHASIRPLVESIVRHHGRVDFLVNSAGVTGELLSTISATSEAFDFVFAINVKATLLMMQAVAEHIIDRGGGGRIVNLTSSAAFDPAGTPVLYVASKNAVVGLTKAAATDLGMFDINVNAIAPGMTKTGMTAGVGDDEAYQRLVSSGPLANLFQRVSEAEDVAAVAVFLCSPESRQITGQVIHTSAGQVI
jgi:NAD(P)-dependent dehydrogenase (short-subunit alcohol dehydrogenase family)